MQHPAAEDLQAQDSLFSGMRQIVINTSNGVSKTILAGMGISSFANIIPRNKTDQYYTGFLVNVQTDRIQQTDRGGAFRRA